MIDRIVEEAIDEVPEIPEMLESLLLFMLGEAKEKMEQGIELVPCTALAVKDNLFIETHPGDSKDECYALAQHTVEGARGAQMYAFCYDGEMEVDDEKHDMIIAEGGVPGEEESYAAGYLYTKNADGNVTFEAEPTYIGRAPNYMAGLKDAEEYQDDEIDERYLEDCDEETDGDVIEDSAE